MSLPLVTVITTCFNSSQTIEDTLRSVSQQDYPHIEHILVDGASSDSTMEIIHAYSHVARIISEKDNGIYDAMNKGLAAATGDIVGFLNSDDFYVSPSVISSVVAHMQEMKCEALYADLVYVHPDQTDRILRSWEAGSFERRKFLFGWMPPHPTFFAKRKLYGQYGGFNTSLKSSADYELMLRFLYKHRISVCYLPKVIIRMRAGGMSNASLSNRLMANREDRMAWKINSLKPYFFTSWLKPLRKITQFMSEKNQVV